VRARKTSSSVAEWVEMHPNREWNWCCGGGGGADYVAETKAAREAAGRLKASQITATGAAVVATGCLSCWSTLQDIVKHNGLGVEVRTMGQILARALVPPG